MLQNGDFSAGSIQSWILQPNGSSESLLLPRLIVVNEGPNTSQGVPGPCVKITTTLSRTSRLGCSVIPDSGKNIVQGHYYKLSFNAKSDVFTLDASSLSYGGVALQSRSGLLQTFNLI